MERTMYEDRQRDLRLFFEAGLSIRAIARTLRVSPEVPAKAGMGDSIRRAKVAGLSWPLPEGLQSSQFCERYRALRQGVDGVMRHHHRAGEKLFVDDAGHTVPIVDRESGARREAQVFVAVLGASSYTYAEATWAQTLSEWWMSPSRGARRS